jgi:hypothetical protein
MGYQYEVSSNKALTANATQTLLQLAPSANTPFAIDTLYVSMDSSAAATAVRFQLVTQTTAGTGAVSPPTPTKKDPNVNRAATVTVTHNHSAEPTLGVIIKDFYLQPFGGIAHIAYPIGKEMKALEGGDRLALRCITPTGVSPSCSFGFEFTEG